MRRSNRFNFVKMLTSFLSFWLYLFAFTGNGYAGTQLPTFLLQTGHPSMIKSVAFSPDGKLLASGSEDWTIKLWSTHEGRLIKNIKGHSDQVTSISFSPDNKLLASGSVDSTIKIWSIPDCSLIKTFDLENVIVNSLVFSPNGEFLAIGTSKNLQIWSISEGRKIKTSEKPSQGFSPGDRKSNNFMAVAFSPDGKLLCSASEDSTIKLWSIPEGQLIKTLIGHTKGIESVSFSPDSSFLASGSRDKTVNIWTIPDGVLVKTLKGHPQAVYSVSFSPDGSFLASSSFDIKLWSVKEWKLIVTFERYSVHEVNSVFFSPNSKFLASGSKNIKLWTIPDGKLTRDFEDKSVKINCLSYSPDGKLLAVGSMQSIIIWSIQEGIIHKVLTDDSAGDVVSIAFSPDSKLLVTGDYDLSHKIKIWSISEGRIINTLAGHSGNVLSVAFSPDGKLIASGSLDKTIRLWSIPDGKLIRTLKGHAEEVKSIVFSPDGKLLASASQSFSNGTIKLWSIPNGKMVKNLEKVNGTTLLAFSSDSKYLVSDSCVEFKVWSILNGNLIKTIKVDSDKVSFISSLSFSPDGKFIASGSDDSTIKLWSFHEGTLVKTLEGHSNGVTAVVFPPDGKFIASGSEDSTIRLWSVSTGTQIATIVGFKDGEYSVLIKNGYYRSSLDAAQRISLWFGGTNVADVSQYELALNRTDIVQKALRGEPIPDPPEIVPPPIVELKDAYGHLETKETSQTIQFLAKDDQSIKSVRVFANGRVVKEETINNQMADMSISVPLTLGLNRLTVIAYNQNGYSSYPQYLDVECNAPGLKKPNLFVLAVGVSKYPNLAKGYQLDYAHKDAGAIAQAFAGQKKLFGEIRVSELTDENATLAKIDEALTAMADIPAQDLAIIFLGGHGVRDKNTGKFYFLTSNASINHPSQEGLDWSILQERLSKMKCRVVLLLDACHAGAISEETVVPNDDLVQAMMSGGRAGAMIFSAAKGRQESVESAELGTGQGLFTWAILEALGAVTKDSKRGWNTRSLVVDTNGNGVIEFSELAEYATRRVNDISDGFQTPLIPRKEIFGDFPIATAQ